MIRHSALAPIEMANPIWWADSWWEDVTYQTEHGLSLEQIRAPIDALKLLFDQQWTQAAINAGPPNVILATGRAQARRHVTSALAHQAGGIDQT